MQKRKDSGVWKEMLRKRLRRDCFKGDQERFVQKYYSRYFELSRVNPSAGGFDIVLKSGCYVELNLNSPVAIRTGLKLIPNFKRTYDIRANSRMLVRGIMVGHGLVDADYSGELIVVVYKVKPNNKKGDKLLLCPGDSIAQLVPETCWGEVMIMEPLPSDQSFQELLGEVVCIYNQTAGFAASADTLGVKSKAIRGDKKLGSSADEDMSHWFAVYAKKERLELAAYPKVQFIEPYWDKEADEAYLNLNTVDLTADTQEEAADVRADDEDEWVTLQKICTWRKDYEAVDRWYDEIEKRFGGNRVMLKREEVEGGRRGYTAFVQRKLFDNTALVRDKLEQISKVLKANGFEWERYTRDDVESLPKLDIRDIDFDDEMSESEPLIPQEGASGDVEGAATQCYEYLGEINMRNGKTMYKTRDIK